MTTKGTRSSINLPGNIRNYILENSSTMPEDPPPPTVVTEAEDVRTLLTIMTRTLTAVT
jgi:hypothetical protein